MVARKNRDFYRALKFIATTYKSSIDKNLCFKRINLNTKSRRCFELPRVGRIGVIITITEVKDETQPQSNMSSRSIKGKISMRGDRERRIMAIPAVKVMSINSLCSPYHDPYEDQTIG